jgi:hypothetical protein
MWYISKESLTNMITKLEFYLTVVIVTLSIGIAQFYPILMLRSHVKTMDKAVSTFYGDIKVGEERYKSNRTLIEDSNTKILRILETREEYRAEIEKELLLIQNDLRQIKSKLNPN